MEGKQDLFWHSLSVTDGLVAEGKTPLLPTPPPFVFFLFSWRGQETLLHLYDSLCCGFQNPNVASNDRRVKVINETNSSIFTSQ